MIADFLYQCKEMPCLELLRKQWQLIFKTRMSLVVDSLDFNRRPIDFESRTGPDSWLWNRRPAVEVLMGICDEK